MKQYVAKSFSLLVLVITLSSGVGAQSRPDENLEEPSKTGAIKGRVVNESGQPLANVSVSVRAVGAVGQSRVTATDSDGNFQVDDLDPLGYLVTAWSSSYATPPRDPNNPQITFYWVGDSVRLELVKGGVITGTVTSQTGEPVIAVRVRAEMIRDGLGKPARYRPFFRERMTDDRGIYRIYGLVPGTYVVSAGGIETSPYNATAYDTDAPTYAPSSTRSDAVEMSVGTGQEIANVDIRYRGEPGHAVSGFVRRPDGSPAPGFTVNLSSVASGTSPSTYSIFQPPGFPGFAIYGVPDGDYDVTAQVFLTGEWTFSDPKRIKVKGADVTGLELTTKPLGSIKGRVVLEESKMPECKGKLRPSFAEMLVAAWHNEKSEAKDRPQFMFSYGSPTVPDKQGDFTLRSLAAGEYRFSARFFAKYWYLQSISLQSSVNAVSKSANSSLDKARNWMLVKSGDQISGLTITLAEGAASLRGSVKTAEGETMPGRINVHLVPAEKEKAQDVLRFLTVAVDADRKFSVSNVPPGRYFALATSFADDESITISKLRLPDEVEARAKLRLQAEAAKTEIELKPCQNLIDYQILLKSPAH